MSSVSLDDILSTAKLSSRAAPAPNFADEVESLHVVIKQLALDPQATLDALVNAAVRLCRAGSAGVSLLETDEKGEEHFRWVAMAGEYAPYVGETTPRDFSPCGTTLDRGTPQLFEHPARLFTYLKRAEPPVLVEGLFVPFQTGEAAGTIWVAAHDDTCEFTSEDVRVLTSLGDFTATTLSSQRTRTRLEQAERRSSRSESRLRQVFESVRDYAIFTIDPLGIVTDWNVGAQYVFGYDESEIVGRNSDILWTPKDRASGAPERERQTALAESCAKDERWHQRRDGSLFFASGVLTPRYEDDGELIGFTKVCRDITARKQAEEQARTILESITDAFFAIDREWRFTYVNAEAERMLLRRRENLLNRVIWDEFPAALGTDFESRYRKAMDERVTVEFVEFYPHPINGWFEVRVYPSPDGLSVYFQDITQRRQAEEALRASEQRYRDLFTTIDQGFCVLDVIFDDDNKPIDYRFVETNPAFERQTGLVDAIGKTARELVPTLEDRWFTIYGEVALTGKPVRFEEPSAPMNRWFDVYAFRVGDSDSRRVALLFRDISNSKRIEQALRESEARFRAMADSAPVLIWLAGLNKLCYWFNKPWLDFTGRTLDQEYGNGWVEGVYPEDVDRCMHIFTSSFDQRVPFKMDYRLRRHDGVYRWVQDHGIPLHDSDGTFTGYIGSCIDITDRKLAEEERQTLLERERAARAEAERASEAKSEFLATLSHELRTPLTPVLLTVSLMESHPQLPQDLRGDVATIRRNVELESRLINDLLDLTRITRDKLQLDMQEVDLHLLVRSAVDICQREASVKLVVDLNAKRHFVRGDSTRLQQIFWNLINNAIKFTGPEGTVTIRSTNPTDDRIRVEVIDTGVGIDPPVLKRLFSPFEQGETRAKRQQAGLGLGLVISRKLAESHGGTITAFSAGKGQGATFTADLPVLEAATRSSKVANETPQSIESRRKLRVLLVEDHEPTLNVMARLLRRLGYRVTKVTSVASAVAVARQEMYDVIVSDLGLPDGSGLDIMRQLGPDYEGRAIALTGYGTDSDVAASRAAGFTEHLTKPVDFTALDEAINRLIGK